jgi:hypothetical protein
MADKKISALTASSTPLAGTEVLPIVQSGSTVKVAVSDLTAGRAVAMGSGSSAGNGSAYSTFTLNSSSAGGFDLNIQTAGSGRWVVSKTATNEDFFIYRYNDSGGYAGNPLQISRSNGNVRLENNLVIGTAGNGIDFSATSGSGTSELLNDYEEGTWTPVIRGAGTAGTYEQAITLATYTKVGRQVTLQCYIALAAVVTGGGTSYLQITGAPFTALSPNQFPTTVLLTDMAKSLTTLYVGVSWATTTAMYFPEVQPTTFADFPVANAVANKTIQFTMTYFV